MFHLGGEGEVTKNNQTNKNLENFPNYTSIPFHLLLRGTSRSKIGENEYIYYQLMLALSKTF